MRTRRRTNNEKEKLTVLFKIIPFLSLTHQRRRTFLCPIFVKFGYVINRRKKKTLYFAENF